MPTDPDGSLRDVNGAVCHFSQSAFAAIAEDTDRCFLCGDHRTATTFNDEHVVPDWILRRFSLHDQEITLPNETRMRYGRYKVRCCTNCNSLLGRELEEPIAELFNSDALLDPHRSAENADLLYPWLCLLFLKTHLKDRDLRAHRDRRREAPQLSTLYEWEHLHHVHSVARAVRSGALIDSEVEGTILTFEMANSQEPFDYGDIYDHSTAFVRIGRIGVVAVLNDCGCVRWVLRDFLSGIDGPLASIQLREIAARIAYGNELLLTRPRFRTELHDGVDLRITCDAPLSPRYGNVDPHALGALLEQTCAARLRMSTTPNQEELLSRLVTGELSFIYDDDGKFIHQLPKESGAQQGDA